MGRRAMQETVEEYLRRGGKIEQVDSSVMKREGKSLSKREAKLRMDAATLGTRKSARNPMTIKSERAKSKGKAAFGRGVEENTGLPAGV